jgi:hypothetical protein
MNLGRLEACAMAKGFRHLALERHVNNCKSQLLIVTLLKEKQDIE